MKVVYPILMLSLLTGCGAVTENRADGREAGDSTSHVLGGSQGPNSSIHRDTVYAPNFAPGYWAVLSSHTTLVEVSGPDDLKGMLDSLNIEGYHDQDRLFSAWLEGGNTIHSPELVAVAGDGSLWILHCVEQSWAEAAGSNFRTISVDGRGKEVLGLAPVTSSYSLTAIKQVDPNQLVNGGHVLDLKKRVWTSLPGGPDEDDCSAFVGTDALLVMGQGSAYFYELPELELRLSFPCDCSGANGSMDNDIFFQGEASDRHLTLGDRAGIRLYQVDLELWAVDSSISHHN